MNEERKTPDPKAAEDRHVSELYRDTARERTPQHLDEAVLREAARAARPRYSRLRLWTRPAAWAAVVLLSATLLLQVSQDELPQDHSVTRTQELNDSAGARAFATPESAAERQLDDLGSAAKATGTTALREQEPVAELLEEVVSQDANMLIRAEEMARMQQGPNDAPAGSQPVALQSITVTGSRLPACDHEARATPETWLDCILELEEVGMDEAADEERTLLAEAFPDFQAP